MCDPGEDVLRSKFSSSDMGSAHTFLIKVGEIRELVMGHPGLRFSSQ